MGDNAESGRPVWMLDAVSRYKAIDDCELIARQFNRAPMDDGRYTVILEHEPDNPEMRRNIIACLSRLDQTAPRRLEKTISNNRRLVIKRDTDFATARRLKCLLQNTGAVCHIKKLAPSPEEFNRSIAASPVPAQHARPRFIECPNCGFRQPPEAECRSCGVILSKARNRAQSRRITAPAPTKGGTKPQVTKPDKMVVQLRRHLEAIVGLWQKIQRPLNLGNLQGWTQRVVDRFIRCGLVFIIALILEIGLVYLSKMLWYLYTETAVGQYYIEKIPENAESIQRVLDADPLVLSWHSTWTVMCTGLLLGGAAQILHLIRYLYDSQGIIGKLILWFAPSVGLNAWLMGQQDPFPDYSLACVLVALPTLCVLPGCLHLAQAALPELGDLRKSIAIVTGIREKTWDFILKKIRLYLDTTKQVH